MADHDHEAGDPLLADEAWLRSHMYRSHREAGGIPQNLDAAARVRSHEFRHPELGGPVPAEAPADEKPEHLGVLADELLALSMPGPAYGPDRARWERNVKGVIARIFRLGQAAGWDKAMAAGEAPDGT